MPSAPRIHIDPNSTVPAVRQITGGIRVLLVSGELEPGTVLPSIRRMAIKLGVHFNTVADAYRELASEGWLELKHGSGAHVIEREARAATGPEISGFRERLKQMAAQMQSHGISAKRVANEYRAIAEVLSK